MNRQFDSFFGRSTGAAMGEPVWAPAVDMEGTKDDVIVSCDIPGVREKKEVSVSIPDDRLTVKGERELQTEAKDE